MINLILNETNNGYIIEVKNATKNNGQYVFRYIDVTQVIEFIGKVLLDKPVEVKER